MCLCAKIPQSWQWHVHHPHQPTGQTFLNQTHNQSYSSKLTITPCGPNNVPCCTFYSQLYRPRKRLLLLEHHGGSVSEFIQASMTQECHSLFPSCQCWVNDGPLIWKTTYNICLWPPGLTNSKASFWLSLIYEGMFLCAHAHSSLLLLSHNFVVRYKAVLWAIKAGLVRPIPRSHEKWCTEQGQSHVMTKFKLCKVIRAGISDLFI